ncbi:hypothetical protein TBLA_0C06340 [Henningerozyma blattae CBS 6284]|uniref:Proteasome alpha-type subunits domain-containing protein n=1 Tax=Henningerozyma blattae (strain ATCC 34711 / CBS 6284 / DSM 70876 / NBRC 10599 / NRRL Y-10934 / UCD 77-7) TaxID=1071380 RepID=I2H227_HENB6|nr:hypothetical protein TBLA_0C06340 [Tetrapisispora blattae CBS 6284]CCH60429.1 hypothetical protein TBLA_0C06340 [Tetrapisispora blattae CBS 6284]
MADRYSFSLTTFSPNGKLGQIDYALTAVKQGVTALGIKATNGVVLATEKKSGSSLALAESLDKISLLTPNIGTVYAGMGPDCRVLVDKARKAAHTNYKRVYGEYPPTRQLVADVAAIMQEATQSGGVRPFGVSLLVAGHDNANENDSNSGFALYQVDPSGAYFPWKATAVGRGAVAAKTFLEKRWHDELELEDAVHIALLALREAVEGEFNGDTLEIAVVGEPNNDMLGFTGVEGQLGPRFRKLTPQEINDRLAAL